MTVTRGGRLLLRGSVLLSAGRWFDSPGLRVRVSLGKILNHRTAPDCALITTPRFLAWFVFNSTH